MRQALAISIWLVAPALGSTAVAGDMSASLKSGVLTIKDSSADDSFTIDQSGLMTTNFRITPDPGTTVNGSAVAQLFSGVTKDVKLVFGLGTDHAEIDDVVIERDLLVNTGVGTAASVGIVNGLDVGRDLRVDTKGPTFSLSSSGTGNIVRRDVKCTLRGTSSNSLAFTPLHVLRNTIIKGASGSDVVVVGANVQLVGNVTFDSGAGIDTYVDSATTVVGGNLKMTGKAGTKTCVASGKVSGDLITDVGNGDGNTVVCTAPKVGGSIRAKFGTGTNNVLTVSSVTVTEGIECTSKGSVDSVTLVGTSCGGDVRVKLGNGTNAMSMSSNPAIGGDVVFTGGQGIDHVSVNASSVLGDIRANTSSAPVGTPDTYSMLLGSVGGDLVVTGGSGDFVGAIEDVTTVGDARFMLGSGNSSFTVDGGTYHSIRATMGSGNDTFFLTGGTNKVVTDLVLKLGSGANTMPISHSTIGRDLIVETGAGSDSISISTTTIIGATDIDLGGGMNSGP